MPIWMSRGNHAAVSDPILSWAGIDLFVFVFVFYWTGVVVAFSVPFRMLIWMSSGTDTAISDRSLRFVNERSKIALFYGAASACPYTPRLSNGTKPEAMPMPSGSVGL